MKRFLGNFAVVLVCVEVFLALGGYLLFDFSHHFFTAGAACALIIALIISAFAAQADKIDSLEKRLQLLEDEKGKSK